MVPHHQLVKHTHTAPTTHTHTHTLKKKQNSFGFLDKKKPLREKMFSFSSFFWFNGFLLGTPQNTPAARRRGGRDAVSFCEVREIIDKATERVFYISTPSLSELLPFFGSFQLSSFEKAFSEPYLGNLLRLNPTCSLALWVCLQNLNGTYKPGMRGGLLFSWLDSSLDWSEPSPLLFLTILLFSFLCNSI